MKKRTPHNRNDLRIRKNDRVLEIGSGHSPSYRADVIVDKFVDDNYHRCDTIKVYPHQQFVHADGEHLPFQDKEFDYVICNQVLEHTDDPAAFIREQCRVARRGYIETPSLIGEYLFPKSSHRWVILDIDGKLVLFEKAKMPGNYGNNYGELFLNYLPYQSLVYRLLWLTEGDLMINRYEWNDEIEFIVNPDDTYYRSFFTQAWNREMVSKLYPRRTVAQELKKIFWASCFLVRDELTHLLNKKKPVTLSVYHELNHRVK